MIAWATVLLTLSSACWPPGDWSTNPDSSAGLIVGVDDCRRLWQYTFWVEMQLGTEQNGQGDALRAAISEVQARHGTPLQAFGHCWNVLKANGYSVSDIEYPAR